MPQVFVSSVVAAPAEKVWATIRRFDAVADWLPFVKSSRLKVAAIQLGLGVSAF